MSDGIKRKTCPFCGTAVTYYKLGDGAELIYCTNKKCGVQPRASSVEAWNAGFEPQHTQPTPAEALAALERLERIVSSCASFMLKPSGNPEYSTHSIEPFINDFNAVRRALSNTEPLLMQNTEDAIDALKYVEHFIDALANRSAISLSECEIQTMHISAIRRALQGLQPEWFYRWIARGKAGYGGMTMEACIGMIWESPDNPYYEKNPWAKEEQQNISTVGENHDNRSKT